MDRRYLDMYIKRNFITCPDEINLNQQKRKQQFKNKIGKQRRNCYWI